MNKDKIIKDECQDWVIEYTDWILSNYEHPCLTLECNHYGKKARIKCRRQLIEDFLASSQRTLSGSFYAKVILYE